MNESSSASLSCGTAGHQGNQLTSHVVSSRFVRNSHTTAKQLCWNGESLEGKSTIHAPHTICKHQILQCDVYQQTKLV